MAGKRSLGAGDGRRRNVDGRRATRRRLPFAGLAVLVLAVAALCSSATSALADGSVTLPGSPLTVSVGSLGECQSSYPNVGVNFYPPSSTVGDCGFFLAFPPNAENPKALGEGSEGSAYGFAGAAGPGFGPGSGPDRLYTAVEQGAPSGSGTAADPYTEVTKFKVSATGTETLDYAVVTVTTQYVNGAAQFTSTYTVRNITGTGATGAAPKAETLRFHAIVAGDLFVANDDHGTGVFLGGPPRFVGGQNAHTGTLGGFVEVPSSPWTNWQEGYWNGPSTSEGALAEDMGIWNAVRTSPGALSVFNKTIDPNLMDNGAGVSWDEFLKNGLKSGDSATFSIINRSQVPTTLSVQPVTQTLTVGQTGTVTVTATDNVGTPYAGRAIVYSIGGPNPKTGSVLTNAAGVATIAYVGGNPGIDTIQMFLDLAGTGSQATQDPASSAQLTWLPKPPPTPDSSYAVQSIHANADGTITIVFVPTQGGTATVEVTVPTGTITRKQAEAARRKKCKRGQIKIRGKCRPATTVSGRTTAAGTAGVPLTIKVAPSSKVRAALKKGRTLHLTAKLTYVSSLGEAPTVHTYSFTVKPKHRRHKH